MLDDLLNALSGQRLRHVGVYQPVAVAEHLSVCAQCRRRHRRCACRFIVLAGRAAYVHQLQHNASAFGMHGLGDPLPTGHLFGTVDRGRPAIAQAAGRRCSAFGDDQPGTGALTVILDHLAARDRICQGSTACHRRHDNSVGQLQLAQGDRLEQDAHFNSSASYCFQAARRLATAWASADLPATMS